MSKYLEPTGESTYGVALCARCSKKFLLAELQPDPNYPGLMVCEKDRDDYDPYRLAPRKEDQITLPFVRPDENIATAPSGVIAEEGTRFIVSEDGQRFLYVID